MALITTPCVESLTSKSGEKKISSPHGPVYLQPVWAWSCSNSKARGLKWPDPGIPPQLLPFSPLGGPLRCGPMARFNHSLISPFSSSLSVSQLFGPILPARPKSSSAITPTKAPALSSRIVLVRCTLPWLVSPRYPGPTTFPPLCSRSPLRVCFLGPAGHCPEAPTREGQALASLLRLTQHLSFIL